MSDDPLMETIVEMTAASFERANLSTEALMLVRLAALVAVDAPTASFRANLSAGAQTTLSLEDARSVLVAVAPIVGAPRVVSAADKIARALGFVALNLELPDDKGDED